MSETTEPRNAWVATVLGFSFDASEQPGDKPASGNRTKALIPRKGETDELGLGLHEYWRASLTLFGMANQQADAQLKRLAAAVEKHDDKSREKDRELREIAKRAIPDFLDHHRGEFLALLRATSKDLAALEEKAGEVVSAAQDFLDGLDSDPRVAACDDNPFGVQCMIFETYRAASFAIILVAQTAERS